MLDSNQRMYPRYPTDGMLPMLPGESIAEVLGGNQHSVPLACLKCVCLVGGFNLLLVGNILLIYG